MIDHCDTRTDYLLEHVIEVPTSQGLRFFYTSSKFLSVKLNPSLINSPHHYSTEMSRAAKATLATTSFLCGGVIWSVHYLQRAEKAAMHAGVIRDEERTRIKRKRQLDFEMQLELEKEYKKSQSISSVHEASGTGGEGKG
ncbi:hypothetical protein HOY80DRAFT_942912 [Tuber brumale]|nr:hypothetical protein HOY80DRAFT_942912 [Tuber brumale]